MIISNKKPNFQSHWLNWIEKQKRYHETLQGWRPWRSCWTSGRRFAASSSYSSPSARYALSWYHNSILCIYVTKCYAPSQMFVLCTVSSERFFAPCFSHISFVTWHFVKYVLSNCQDTFHNISHTQYRFKLQVFSLCSCFSTAGPQLRNMKILT